MTVKISSIIDAPKLANANDLLGVDKYTKALSAFIESAATPITIALQGEWGSGKTSMMNTLKENLCVDSKSFYGIWINTWQYSLLEKEEFVLVKIIKGIIDEIAKYVGKDNSFIEKTTGFFKSFLKRVLPAVAGTVGGDGAKGALDEFLGNGEVAVKELKDSLSNAIKECLNKNVNKKGFIFFIDDLDRIEPVMAVQILELLKNVFDIDNCVFLLAIDYDVVVKGLKPKFGELTDKNEREFRSFFDKIIQLPFTLPVASYEVENFLKNTFKSINYLSENEARDEELIETIARVTDFSVGKNPRSLKRLINSLSLIKIINDGDNNREILANESYQKVINIGLVSIQISYNYIYQLLTDEPNFKKWDNAFADKHRLPELDKITENLIKDIMWFDEVWEKILYRACMKDTYLKNNAYNISQLLNLLAEQLPTSKQENALGDTMESILSLSSVTNVESTNEAPKSKRGTMAAFDIGTFEEPELRKKLVESFTRDSQLTPRLVLVFELLVEKKKVNREEIKKMLASKIMNSTDEKAIGQAGRYLSNVSQFITKRDNKHMRQVLDFERDSEKQGGAGERKNTYTLHEKYVKVVDEALKESKTKK